MRHRQLHIGPLGACLLACVVACLGGAEEAATSRGLKPLVVRDERGQAVTFAEHHALIIGNSQYTGAWEPLPGVVKDVTAVKECLESQGFDVQVAMDLTKQSLSDLLDGFIEEKAQREDARVVIYYAGHGYSAGKIGYLVGVDAPKPSEKGFFRKAYEIANVKVKAQQAKSRHVLFAFDSCFSGSIFTPMRGANDYVLSAARDPVRLFLTSGSADEVVPDQSFFRQEFIAGLGGLADANKDGYVTGSELGLYLKQAVHDRAAAAGIKLTPQAGVSEQEGFNRGDMVFAVIQRAGPGAPAAAFSLDDVRAETAASKAQWEAWQVKMDAALKDIQGLPVTEVELRRKAWQRFLSVFSADNPYSTVDDQGRDLATRELAGIERRPVPAPTGGAGTAAPQPGGVVSAWAGMDVSEAFHACVGRYIPVALNTVAEENIQHVQIYVMEEKKPMFGATKPRQITIEYDNPKRYNLSGFPRCTLVVASMSIEQGDLVLVGTDTVTSRAMTARLHRDPGTTRYSLNFGTTTYAMKRD